MALNTDSKVSASRNDALFERAKRVIPGGVNSPVRAFRAVGGTPVFFESEFYDFYDSWEST